MTPSQCVHFCTGIYLGGGGHRGGRLPADLSDRLADRQTDSDRLGLADSDRLGSWTDSDGLPVTGPPGRLRDEPFKFANFKT